MKSKLVLCLAIFLSFGAVAHDDDIDQLVAFGDSLSDPGNFLLATGTTEVSKAPFLPIPDAPYQNLRFTNGKVWVERLAREIENRKGGKPAFKKPGRFTNYAVGRARARAGSPIFPDFHLADQVGTFLTDFGDEAPPDALYSVWIGSNDLSEAIAALELDPFFGLTLIIIEAAIQATVDNVITLHSRGARIFLIPNLPNAGVTPAALAQLPVGTIPFPFIAQLVTEMYNEALEDALLELEAPGTGLPGIKIIRLDAFTIVNDIVADPTFFGFANVTNSCISPGVNKGAICDRRNKYLFWDFIHPTKRAHRILSEIAEDVVEEAFEDGTRHD